MGKNRGRVRRFILGNYKLYLWCWIVTLKHTILKFKKKYARRNHLCVDICLWLNHYFKHKAKHLNKCEVGMRKSYEKVTLFNAVHKWQPSHVIINFFIKESIAVTHSSCVIKIYDVIMDSFIKVSIDETHSTCIIKIYHVVKMRLKFQTTNDILHAHALDGRCQYSKYRWTEIKLVNSGLVSTWHAYFRD